MSGERGAVLINALILVAAMAAAALLVLRQSETTRATLASSQQADQLVAYLDAFEAYAIATLMFDDAQVDHPGEAWASPAAPFELDRGQVRGVIVDLQSRFNLNWIANPADQIARSSFDTLLESISARPGVGDVLDGALRFDLAEGRGYGVMDPPAQPIAGPRVMMQQLARIPDLTAQDKATLASFATVLPGDSTLNINTVTDPVLAGFFPDLTPEQLRGVLARRAQAPYGSVDDFLSAIEDAQGAALGEDFDRSRFNVGSDWFGVTIDAALDGRQARRDLVLERKGPGRRPRVYWRITQLN